MDDGPSVRPLSGICVVALEHAVAAPFATRQLADLGARVIKVERPGAGDFARGYDATVHGESSYFVWLNRSKESIELDVKDPGDRAVLDELIDGADVFVQNLGPGAATRIGLGADALRARRPRLIHCSISGYGAEGPYASKKAYDLLIQCEAGLLATTGTADTPAKVGISVADIATGMYAYTGILTALYTRERTGEGATIEVAMLDALGEWMMQPTYFGVYGDRPVTRSGARHASIAPYGPYRVGDGSTVFLGVQNDREWNALCSNVIRRADLTGDERFESNDARVRHDDVITELLEDAFAASTADDVINALEAAGIACAQLRSPAEFARHPQLQARQRWQAIGTPGGEVNALLPPVTIQGQRPRMGDVPELGAHNEAIRREVGARRR